MAICIKVPYVSGKLDISECSCNPYNMLHNTMYYATKDNYKTYFYHKNNLIKYYNEITRNSIIIPNLENNTYTPIKFNQLRQKIDDNSSLVVKDGDGKWYIIMLHTICSDGKDCVAVIDAQSGQEIWTTRHQSVLKSLILYSIANTVVPIIHATNSELCVYLFDLSTKKCHELCLDVKTLGSLALEVLQKAQVHYREIKEDIVKDTITHIINFEIHEAYYNNRANKNIIDEIQVKAKLTLFAWLSSRKYYLDNLILEMIVEDNHIVTRINLEEAHVHTGLGYNTETPVIYLKNYTDKLNILWSKHKIDKVYDSIYYANLLYESDCHYILGRRHEVDIHSKRINSGIVLNQPKDYGRSSVHYYATLYRYKKYLFIIHQISTIRLTIIDLERKLTGVWYYEKRFTSPSSEETIYDVYYSKKNNKIVFLEQNCYELFLVDIQKVENFFNSIIKNEHKELEPCVNRFGEINEIMNRILLRKLIEDAINKVHKGIEDIKLLKLLGRHIDEKNDSFYIAYKYRIHYQHKISEQYIGLFLCTIHDGKVHCELVEYKYFGNKFLKSFFSKIGIKQNIKKRNYPISISNIEPYMINKIRCEELNNLDIAYVNNRFTSFKHNRSTLRLGLIRLRFNCYEDEETSTGETIKRLGNLIWGAETGTVEARGLFCFLVNGMFVVKQMREESQP